MPESVTECWLCGYEDDFEKGSLEERLECGQMVCTDCEEWGDDGLSFGFICHHCMSDDD